MVFSGEEQLAFEGAQGFGAATTGGRGGEVVKVTNLNDAGEGSLRWALEELSGPRIVVFEVGGQIDLLDQISINGDVTIAGQTAPGGITITGGRLHVGEDNVIIRGLNIRPGDNPEGQAPESRDGISIGNGPTGAAVSNVIIDSNSISWSLDEAVSLFGFTSNITLSNNIVSEALNQSLHPKGAHGFALFLSVAATEVSIVGNLLAHNESRNPSIWEGSNNIEFINNVVYNYGTNGLVADGGVSLNIINNLFIPGPDTARLEAIRLFAGEGQVFLSGNMAELVDDSDLTRLTDDFAFAPATSSVLATEDVLQSVLASAGAQVPDRNAIDARVIETVLEGTGQIIDEVVQVGGYLPHDGSLAPLDTDGDGIPDIFEQQLGSDPNLADASGDADNNGASNIEDYINGLLGAVPEPRPNAAPTGVLIVPVVDALLDNVDTSDPIKIADIAVIDDALGDNILSVVGADVDKFEIVGTSLFLAAGAALDFATQPTLTVTVQVDDPTVGTEAFDASSDFTLSILDASINNPPLDLIVTPLFDSLTEATDTSAPIKVADLTVVDDALGENTLFLTGADAALFEIVGTELFLRAGVVLDFNQKMSLDVTVEVDDPLVGEGDFDASAEFSLAITAPMSSPIRIEAEDPAAVLDTFRVEGSNQRIGLPSNSSGTATYDLGDIPVGTYKVTLGLWDEADGQSQVTVSLMTNDGTQVVENFVLDDDATSSNLADATSFRERLLADTIAITAESQLQITAIRDAAEGTRFDYIELQRLDSVNLAPTAVTLTPILTELPEDANTSAPIKIADIAVTDDGLGENALTLTGADAASFEIVGTELFLAAGAALDFETQPTLSVTVQVDDPTVGGPIDAFAELSLAVTDVAENLAPTAVTLTPILTELPEDANTAAPIKIADIAVTDDGLGENALTLTGADAASFEIVGTELFLVAGAALDFETQPTLSVTVQVDDPTVGGPIDAFAKLSLAVSDVAENQAPTAVTLTPVVESLPETTDTSVPIKIADIAVTDDGLGTNLLSLAGMDAESFEIIGDALYLRSGIALDFDVQSALDVTVQVDDPLVGDGPFDASASFTLAVADVGTRPTDPIRIQAEVPGVQLSGFRLEAGNSRIGLPKDGAGTATYDLSGLAAGTYTVTLGLWDEADGQSNLSVSVITADGPQLIEAFVLDDDATSSNLAIESSFRERLLPGTITVTADTQLQLAGVRDAAEGLRIDYIDLIPVGGGNVAPLAVNILPVTPALPEDTDTSAAIKVADIFVVDDGIGVNVLSLGGPDADRFEIVGTELFLRAGAALDFETQSALNVTVQVDDPTVGATVDASAGFTLTVTNVVEPENTPPTDVVLSAVIESLPEDTDTTAAIRIADISVVDDGLGTNLLSVGGTDAESFEIVGNGLFLRAGTVLDYATKAAFDVSVFVDDPLVGEGAFDAAVAFTLAVADVVEPVNAAPTDVTLLPVLESIADTADTASPIKVADISIVDDGLGTNLLSLAGTDADAFEIIDGDLFLTTGVALNFDVQALLDVTVLVDDPGVGTGAFDASADLSLSVTDGGDPILQEVVIAVDSYQDDWEQFRRARSSDLGFGEEGNKSQYVGIRFDNIDIPAGATLVEAYLRFEAFRTNTGNATYLIEIEDSEDVRPYARRDNPSDRSYADSFVWRDVEDWVQGQVYRTPDISGLIDTIVGADGATDAALAFQITGSGKRAAVAFDEDPGAAPELVLVFESDTLL